MSALPPWQEQPGGLPAELQRALRAAPGQPSQAELAVVAHGLSTSLGLDLAAPHAAAGTQAVVVGKPALGLISSGLVGLVAGVGLSAAVAVSFGTSPRPEVARTPGVVRGKTTPRPPEVVAPHAAEPVSVPPLEPANREPSRASVPSPSANVGSEASPLEAMEAELALLQQARGALASNPSRALALCADHARMFAGGTLTQEREVIAIDALLHAGRASEARERARRFHESFPGSAHARRVAALLEAARER